MRHTEGNFNATDDLELYYQAWLPALKAHGEPKAVFAVIHGYGEHSGRYLNPVSYFVPRGHINRFDEYLSDTDAFLKIVRQLNPGCKLFLLGHSLGGLIVSAYVENYPTGELSGLLMSSAFLGFKLRVSAAKAAIGRLMSNLVPAMTMKNDLSAALLSHDPAVVAAYDTDPLNHHVATARFFTEITAAQARTLERAGEVKLPLLVMYAGDDQIVDPECSRVFFEGAASADKTTHRYDNYYHEIFNEANKEAVFKDMENWLVGRV